MAYSKTIYVNDSTPAISAENLNKSENELSLLDYEKEEIRGDFDDTNSLVRSSNYFTGVWVDGISLNADGTTTSNSSRGVTDFMDIEPGTYYFHYANSQPLVSFVRVLMYDFENSIVASAVNQNYFTVPNGVKKIRLCSHHDYLNDKPNVTKESSTGSSVYEAYYTPYFVSKLPEVVAARTNVNGNSFETFGERIGADERNIIDTNGIKSYLPWQLGNINSNTSSANYGKIVAYPYRIACCPIKFDKDTIIDIDWTKYRIYLFGYENAQGGNPKNIGWLGGTWIAPKNKYIGLEVSRLSDDTEYSSVYNELYNALVMQYVDADVNKYGKNVLSINHRGYTRYIPEESELAYRLSAVAGFQAIETDVHFTSDGVPICTHNEIVISDGTHINPTRYTTTEDYPIQINVEETDFDTLDGFDWGYYVGTQYKGTKVLKFEKLLDICRSFGLIPYIELKATATMSDSQITTLVNLVKDYGLAKSAVWFGGEQNYLEKVHELLPLAKIGIVTGAIDSSVISKAEALRENNEVFVSPSDTGISSAGISLCKAANIPVIVWIGGTWGVSEESLIQGFDNYVSGVISNQIPAGLALQRLY